MSDFSEYERILDTIKNQVKVLILGPYDENCPKGMIKSCKEVLEDLKQFLISQGFLNTRLVKDWKIKRNIPQVTFASLARHKSFHFIDNWAEILVFVFFENGNNSSVGREFGHMVDSSREKCKYSTILRQNNLDLGTIIKGDINSERIVESQFLDKKELYDYAFAGCHNSLFSFPRNKFYDML